MAANPLNLVTVSNAQTGKETTINDMTEALSQAVTSTLVCDLSAGNLALSQTQFTRNMNFRTTGNAVARDLTTFASQRVFIVENGGTAVLSIKRGTTTLALAAGAKGLYVQDGTANDLREVTKVNSVSGELSFAGVISPAQITANQNDYNPTGLATSAIVRINSDAAGRQITGLAGGTEGRFIMVTNVGAFDIVLKDENAGSSASNRFGFGADVTIGPKKMVVLVYDFTSSRWRAVSGGTAGATTFTGLSDVPSSYTGHALKFLRVVTGETGLEFFEIPYAVPTFVPGTMVNAQLVQRFVAIEAFRLPSGLSGSQAKAATASTGNVNFDIKKNGSDVGDVVFNVSGTGTFTLASNQDFAVGDVLELTGPATADATLADVSIVLKGKRI